MKHIELPIPGRYAKIDGYDDYYITDTGDVYSFRKDNRGWQGLRKMAKRGWNNPKRYIQVILSKDGIVKYVQVHRLVAKYFCEGYFPGAVVNHIDGNIHNNHYKNLEWTSQLDNIHKSYKSSGVDQVRNYKMYNLIAPDGRVLGEFKGRNKAVDYIRDSKIPASASSLIKYGTSKGYQLLPN